MIWLANYSLNYDLVFHALESPSTDLRTLLFGEVIGVTTLRLLEICFPWAVSPSNSPKKKISPFGH